MVTAARTHVSTLMISRRGNRRLCMQKFQTRVSYVEAVRWNGTDHFEEGRQPQGIIVQRGTRTFVITPDGEREIQIGDWLIRDSSGAYMPMSHELFRQKYEPLELSCPVV
jgi:hypothetical protein